MHLGNTISELGKILPQVDSPIPERLHREISLQEKDLGNRLLRMDSELGRIDGLSREPILQIVVPTLIGIFRQTNDVDLSVICTHVIFYAALATISEKPKQGIASMSKNSADHEVLNAAPLFWSTRKILHSVLEGDRKNPEGRTTRELGFRGAKLARAKNKISQLLTLSHEIGGWMPGNAISDIRYSLRQLIEGGVAKSFTLITDAEKSYLTRGWQNLKAKEHLIADYDSLRKKLGAELAKKIITALHRGLEADGYPICRNLHKWQADCERVLRRMDSRLPAYVDVKGKITRGVELM